MKPIICQNCKTEVIPHETFRQRWEDAYEFIFGEKFVSSSNHRVDLLDIYFNCLNSWEITQFIQNSKKSNIKDIKDNDKVIAKIYANKKEG